MKKNNLILDKVHHIEGILNIYDELSSLDFTKAIFEQVTKLDEDLLQITFNNGNILDIGWIPAFEEEGKFIIQVISNEDWEMPIYTSFASWDEKELSDNIDEALKNCSYKNPI
ncbi:hypothetical protein ABEJ01_13730 [Enterobacter ludwigii]|uniref:hypothetical protein n=1 Tax=Enterobacter ludwigii TaxID=299767 RepID=UPI00320A9C1E